MKLQHERVSLKLIVVHKKTTCAKTVDYVRPTHPMLSTGAAKPEEKLKRRVPLLTRNFLQMLES